MILAADFYYAYRAMRVFYGQGRFKTGVKYLLLMFRLLFILTVLIIFMFLFSLYKL